MIKSAVNYVLCEIERKFQDQDGKIFIDTTWEPAEFATLEGTVISAPYRTQSDHHRKITGSVKEGDRIFFSYSVIFDYIMQPDEDTPIYRNLVIYEGKEYWRVDMGEIFCTVEADGKLKMVTDNILLEPIDNETGIVKAMPEINLSCNVRDVVCFETKYVQRYNIFGEEHYILPSRRILAKV
jgi:co-chaperonin GroES (HSP10)